MIDKKLLRLLGNKKNYIIYTVLAMLAGLAANLCITASICRMISVALKTDFLNNDFSVFLPSFMTALAGIIVRYISSRITGDLKDTIGRSAKKELRCKIYNKILLLGVRTTDDMSMAGLTQAAIEGVEQLDLYYSSYIPQFFYAMIAPVILFLVTVWIDWHVALVLLCCVPLIPVSIVAVSRYAKKIFGKYWGQYTSMGDSFLDSVQGLKELKIFQADAAQHKKMNETSEEFRQITMKVLVMQLASTTIMDLVAYGGAAIGISMSVFSAANNDISAIQALFLILVAVDFFLPLRAFGSAFHVAMNGVSAGNKIMSILDEEPYAWGSNIVDGTELRLENATFTYDNERSLLKDVSMVFPEKKMVAIAGLSGCGKSTVANMLCGAIHPQGGLVTIAEKSIKELSREHYYSKLALVSCNTYVFNASIRDNFKMADNTVTDEQIYKSLKKVRLDAFILNNGGLDKVISEDASNLSGGQKQRLVLAINLAADKEIYIFDEATSNIDIESESIIMDNICELSKNKSVILISHRLANIVRADIIYYMEAGIVKESGSHSELMANNSSYAKLYLMQKELENGYMEDADEN